MVTVTDTLNQYDPNLPDLQKKASETQQTALDYQTGQSELPAKLRQAIEEKVNYNQDIIQQQNKAMANYFAAPSEARQKYQDIWDPFAREALVSRSVANAYAPYASLTDILGERRGTIADIINQGVGGFNAATTAAQGRAGIAQNALDRSEANAKWLYEMTHPKPSSRAPKSKLEQMIEDRLTRELENKNGTGQGGNVPQPTEPEPQYSPQKNGDTSPGGQWVYWNGAWNPVVQDNMSTQSSWEVVQE